MFVTKFDEITVSPSFLESKAFRQFYLPLGVVVITTGLVAIVIIRIIHCSNNSRRINSVPASNRINRHGSPPPTYNRVNRDDRLRRIMNIMSISAVVDNVQAEVTRSPPNYECAVEHDSPPPTYAYINVAFDMPPAYSP